MPEPTPGAPPSTPPGGAAADDPGPTLDVLVPAGHRPIAPDPDEVALIELHAAPSRTAPTRTGSSRTAPTRTGPRTETPLTEAAATGSDPPGSRWVRANMIGTIDGAATGSDGVSGSINGAADHRVFEVLRALADVVLIGASTARAEGYTVPRVAPALVPGRLTRGLPTDLELAVVTRSGAMPPSLLGAGADGPRPYVLTVASCPSLRALRDQLGEDRVVVCGEQRVDLARGLAELAVRGLSRVLAEGGPHLLADLVAADLVDELCVTTSPVLVGGPAGRLLQTDRWLEPPRAPNLAHLLHADGVLLARWLLRDPAQPSVPGTAETAGVTALGSPS